MLYFKHLLVGWLSFAFSRMYLLFLPLIPSTIYYNLTAAYSNNYALILSAIGTLGSTIA